MSFRSFDAWWRDLSLLKRSIVILGCMLIAGPVGLVFLLFLAFGLRRKLRLAVSQLVQKVHRFALKK